MKIKFSKKQFLKTLEASLPATPNFLLWFWRGGGIKLIGPYSKKAQGIEVSPEFNVGGDKGQAELTVAG